MQIQLWIAACALLIIFFYSAMVGWRLDIILPQWVVLMVAISLTGYGLGFGLKLLWCD